ncbi:MAG: isoprenylcysteine carboxylmethyltransferase family protein [Hoeflea sp.]|uniref:methyltransferase family protein n=1 Tax=Hoeflea sp. TaxID=1940281 RepID=UPI001DFE2293|nr:isoprenylcysteine carboxylmethyltransferase family protein [Hoeflea sp.]MBU4531569.1 isoprenylcysteine carboxylmethyltransferase family protein [Alphaproteobacteria bacterium]MBU4544426.1 isoprenylcysteine carboxylmethyltransferase family protein [Alphaproteobacteria bacterium]MBU4550337.1 isoprenylcysteine carboxylmethyltransferase family protein [Alphaproteobacteria bacterium]MBV1724845.1 isoprenylcysteine carboxylmethyltransferase family protein [Hoeflea sp.]MBV1760865.1 isoprenylcystein
MLAARIDLGRVQKIRIAAFWIIALTLGSSLLFVRSGWEDTAPFGIGIEDVIELLGLGLIGIAVTGRLWATLYVGGRKSIELVQDGPYSVTRNPLYVFSTIGAFGVGMQTGSLLIGALAALITALVLILTARQEADFLRSKFGAEFEEYEKRVPMFFPRPSLYVEPETLQILPRRLYSTLFDGAFFFLAFPLLELVEVFQEQGLLPVLFNAY